MFMSSLQNFLPSSSGDISGFTMLKCSMLSYFMPSSTATSCFNSFGYFLNSILNKTSDLKVYFSFVPLVFVDCLVDDIGFAPFSIPKNMLMFNLFLCSIIIL